jgi:hypothetical protein
VFESAGAVLLQEVSSVERVLRALLDEEAWQPRRLLDLGAGTGAAQWLPVEEPVRERRDASAWAAPGVVRPAAPSARSGPGDAALALRAALDAVTSAEPASLPGAVALERARVLLRESERLQAVALAALADVERRELFALDDTPSTAAWVAQQGVEGLAREDVALARRLARLPSVSAAVLSGELSRRAGAEVARTVLAAAPHLDRPDGTVDGLDGEAVLHGVCVDGVRQLLGEQGRPVTDEAATALAGELEALLAAGGSQRDRLEACLLLFARRCSPELLRSGLALLLDALLPV